MAVEITGPFTFTGVVDGRPVFGYTKRGAISNKYAGVCKDCGTRVEAEKGLRVKDGGAWKVAHKPGECAPKAAEPVAAPQAPRRGTENRFPGSCFYCGQHVDMGEGIRFMQGTIWKVAHCVCPEGAAQLQKPVEQPVNRPINVLGGEIELGYFTVVHEDGSWTTVRVYRPHPAKRVKLAYLFGRSNDFAGDYRDFASVSPRGSVSKVWLDDDFAANERLRLVVKTLVGDPEAAGKAYALRATRCWKCNRKLTTPGAIADGIGEDCKRQRGA